VSTQDLTVHHISGGNQFQKERSLRPAFLFRHEESKNDLPVHTMEEDPYFSTQWFPSQTMDKNTNVKQNEGMKEGAARLFQLCDCNPLEDPQFDSKLADTNWRTCLQRLLGEIRMELHRLGLRMASRNFRVGTARWMERSRRSPIESEGASVVQDRTFKT
jgi:hypothetical protein